MVTATPMSRNAHPAARARLRADVTVNPVMRGTWQLGRVVAPLTVAHIANGMSDRHTTDAIIDHAVSDRFIATPYLSGVYTEVAPRAWFEISSTRWFQ